MPETTEAAAAPAATPTKTLLITWDEFVELYKPKQSPGGNGSYDGVMFETYGAEFEQVAAAADNCVWTVLDCDGELVINSGRSFVNRFGYFITENPAPANRFTEVIDDPEDYFGRLKRARLLDTVIAGSELSPGMQDELERWQPRAQRRQREG